MDTSNTGTVVTQGQMASDNSGINQFNPNTGARLSAGESVTVAPPVSQTQNASDINSHISGGTTATVFPPPPSAPHTQGTSANTSIPNPIASATDIINQGNQQTPGEATNQSLLQKVASLIGQKQSQTGLVNTAESNAGVPGLQKTVNDLNTQLEGLNNQATDLQNQARPGGAIENMEQQNALGRGITVGGLAPMTAGDLRKNQIQQSAIASQALTLKSAIYGAQGNLTLAKDAADKAAQAQYEDQQNQIDYQNALIAANLPQMNKEEKNQALLVQTKLADRQTQIQQAQEDKKTIIALAVTAMTNNPGNKAAQYAAQQALAESNQQQPNLKTALGLVGSYQKDPNAVALQIAQIQNARANTAKTLLETKNLNLGAGSGTALQPYLKTAYDGSQYVDVSGLTPKDKLTYTQLAQSQGLKAVQNPTEADKLQHIAVTKSNLNDIMNTFNAIPVEKNGFPAAQGVSNSIKSFFGDPQIKAYQNFRTSAISTLQALAGGSGSGLRINQGEIDAAVKDIPVLTGPGADTRAQAQAKIDNLNGQLDKWNVQILGGGNTAAKDASSGTTVMTGPGGTFNVPNAQVALFKSNGYK